VVGALPVCVGNVRKELPAIWLGRRLQGHAALFAVVAFVLANLFGATAAQAPCAGNTCTVAIASDPPTSPSGTTGSAGTRSFALARSRPLWPIFNAVRINSNGSRNTIAGSIPDVALAPPALLSGRILSRGIA
jgi:hypothetical protein